MILKKYITFENDNGDVIKNKILPMDIPANTIHTISPWFNDFGALLKEVTMITDIYGTTFKIKGNWQELTNVIRNNNRTKIGL
jgi:hypothetical protein